LTDWLTARDTGSIGASLQALIRRNGVWATWLVPSIYVGCFAAFGADLTSADTLAFGVFYVPLVATAVFHRDKRAVWVLTGIACAMVTVGSFFPAIAADIRGLVWNRILSIGAIIATAVFVWHARSIQEQLAQQTARAEAAERIRAEVLTNLSQEIRAPLRSMIGVLELVATNLHPDQSRALGMVRSSGRRLVSTIDNLVDLTQFDEHAMPAERVDLGGLLRQAVESGREDARARQISVTIDIPSDHDRAVHTNPWALRRILENKIADAITYTPPGGHIDISTEMISDHVSAVIAATGRFPPGAMRSTNDLNVVPLMPSVMGQELSQRLADAIDARLLFSNGPGDGTTVRLLLPSVVARRVETAQA